jgi:hypothetical protein
VQLDERLPIVLEHAATRPNRRRHSLLCNATRARNAAARSRGARHAGLLAVHRRRYHNARRRLGPQRRTHARDHDDPLLVGASFYQQALVLDPAAGNPFDAVMSDATVAVIGDR